MPLEGVPRTLGVRGFFAGVLDGVEVIPITEVIAIGGESDEEKPADTEFTPDCAGGVLGVVD